MKLNKTILAATALAMLATAGTATLATAQDRDGNRGHRAERSQGGERGMGRLQGLIELYDTNADGSVTQEEIDAARAAQLTEFDTDGDGALSLAEYEALWLDAYRERMVDRFQSHDDDGDGIVTAQEFGERQAALVQRMDRNEDGAISIDDLRRGGRGEPRDEQ